ncbi:MAG: YraN family protein [Lachnospiraceae bacterium]|nr:YraN family protein [Lachnospiraceae bacterium]
MKNNNRKVGIHYEELAARYLQDKGYQILERNYRTPCGEIDIIARQGNTLVFVEIKFRSGEQYGTPSEAVDYVKRQRISKVALYFYSRYGYEQELPCRFDVIAICGGERIEHIEDAFDFAE